MVPELIVSSFRCVWSCQITLLLVPQLLEQPQRPSLSYDVPS